MKKVFTVIGHFILWILVAFLISGAIVYFPNIPFAPMILLAILIAPVKKWQSYLRKKLKMRWIKPALIILLIFCSIAAIDYCYGDTVSVDDPDIAVDVDNNVSLNKTSQTDVSNQDVQSSIPSVPTTLDNSWRDNFANELVSDIEIAFAEIGENADNISYIEYVSTMETDLFDRRDYKVEFESGDFSNIFDEDERPWRHNRWYRITTEEWHEGEPEREQYPREYLVTIKFWTDDKSTNINQWTHTGNGALQ